MAKQNGFNASFLQVRVAYENFFGEKIPSGTTFQEAGEILIKALGYEEAKAYIRAIENSPDTYSVLEQQEK